MRTPMQPVPAETELTSPTDCREVILPRRTSPGRLRIATLSWSTSGESEEEYLTEKQFLTTLEQVHERDEERFDLLLAAGRTLETEPRAKKILSRTAGLAVLFEVGRKDEWPRWILAHPALESQRVALRERQLICKRTDSPKKYNRLTAALLARHGVIRLDDASCRFVLFICGENNALQCSGTGSVLCYPCEGLSEIMDNSWLVLNPSHNPYWPQSKMTGFTKVGKVHNAGPTLGKLTRDRNPRDDKTRPPKMVIHCNNFFAENEQTETFASVVFSGGERREPCQEERGHLPSSGKGDELYWHYAVYLLPV